MKLLRPFWFIVAMAVSLGLLALVWHLRQSEQLVGQIQTELATLPDNEVETSMRRFAELGEAGLNALATSLTSDRAAVRQCVASRAAGRNRSMGIAFRERGRSAAGIACQGAGGTAPEWMPRAVGSPPIWLCGCCFGRTKRMAAPSPWLADCEAVLETTAENRRPNGNKSPHQS